jgi:FkbH-like protein
MLLRPEHFASLRINWQDKATNLRELAKELNIGIDAIAFIDDNPVERARVREALPEVFVPEWPEDKLLYPSALHGLHCFDAPAISQEDTKRTALYAAERQRNELKRDVGSVDDWLMSLGIRVRAEPLGPANLTRTTQLLNKTNQMNLSTRRLTEAELVEWVRDPARALWTVTVSDRFGDAGLTGIVSVEADGDRCRIIDFILSCRVMGRRVEESMVHLAVEWARARALCEVVAHYRKTAKNKPCHDFWRQSHFAADAAEEVFTWDAREPYALPACITLEQRS